MGDFNDEEYYFMGLRISWDNVGREKAISHHVSSRHGISSHLAGDSC